MGILRRKSAKTPPASTGRDSENEQDFQKIYQENIGLIYRYVLGKVGHREEAEDLVSQIFLKAVSQIDRERASHSVQQWLFHVARTTVADYWRTHYRISFSSLDEMLDAGWEGPAVEEATRTGSQPAERVTSILQLLPEQYREVLTCRFLLNLSIHDTSERLGLTETNVKVLQFRALKRAAELESIVTS